ncbi:hypothetical protein CWE13_02835 [Aliidiomarina shirensis]|uniref:Bacterial bifunctional deaminase-reductase C-terminal domain-containing protein n=1 Tax=Aliidiomarina shirensis TaxID=1048642 RepID=A0A432WXT7_9GAMM|nr:dihydrofolate reductase family protein [Aliidiomarina shirensis]RUO38598.1 hypothetical protein CWE13_02835 [Aliidiomarina shirensis]
MAHVIHSINITASGLCHHMDSIVDDAHHKYAIDLMSSADALILGRNTFDLFMNFWPGALKKPGLPTGTLNLAKALNSIPKFIVSNRPIELTWNNVKRIPGSSLEGIRKELEILAGNAVVFGSPTLASSLLNEELVDELHIVFQPFVGVEGPRAFNEINKRVSLSLLSVDEFTSGAVLMRYKVNY